MGTVENKSQQVVHVGKLSLSKIVVILQPSSDFVMPNRPVIDDLEDFELVFLEACLCRVSVFAADTDGIPDAIQHNRNGYLLPSGAAKERAYTLNAHLEGKAKRILTSKNIIAFTTGNYRW